MSSPQLRCTPKVLFLYGLSSTGKSTFGEFLKQERGWIFYEIDQTYARNGDGIDKYKLRSLWDDFRQAEKCNELLTELRSRAAAVKAPGVVMCFPSRRELEKSHVSCIQGKIALIYFVGKKKYCVREFKAREERTGNNYPVNHWQENNQGLIEQLKDPELKKYQIDVFNEDGSRKTRESILKAVEELLI